MGGTWALLDRVRERREAFSARSAGRTPFRWLLPAGLAAAAFLAAVSALWWFTARRAPVFANSGSSEVVGPATIDLPDGSVVQVNAGSAIEVRFTAANRNVRLVRGEARFAVAKDKKRAFLVDADGILVRAVGTAFDVRLSAEKVDVLVTEGKVQVIDEHLSTRTAGAEGKPPVALAESLARPLTVAAGERVSVLLSSRVLAKVSPTLPSDAEPKNSPALQQRRLEFLDAPLWEMVDNFNRCNRHQLVIADRDLAAERFGGSLEQGDPRGFVRLLKTHFDVVTEERDDKTILKRAP